MVRVAVFLVLCSGCGKRDEPTLAYAPVEAKEKPKMQPAIPMVADEKDKEPVKLPPKPDDKFTEKVTVRPYGGPGRFLDPHKDQLAYPIKIGKEDGFAIKNGLLYKPGSEIEQADGTIWVVVKSNPATADGESRIQVARKKK